MSHNTTEITISKESSFWQSRTTGQKAAIISIAILAIAAAIVVPLELQNLNEYVIQPSSQWIQQGFPNNLVVLAESLAVVGLVSALLWAIGHNAKEEPFWASRTRGQKVLIVLVSLVSMALLSYLFATIHNINYIQELGKQYKEWAFSSTLRTILGIGVPAYLLGNLLLQGYYAGYFLNKKNYKIPRWMNILNLPISSYVTEGLAKIFGFEVLRHATSFGGYAGILKAGLDPKYGGGDTGSCAARNAEDADRESCRGYNCVFKDSEAVLIPDQYEPDDKYPMVGQVMKRTHPRFHAVKTGGSENCLVSIILGIARFFFSPTLRFVYRRDEITKDFINDERYDGLAYKTKLHLPPERLGLAGILSECTFEDFTRSFKERPGRALLGVVQLVGGVALTCLGLGLML